MAIKPGKTGWNPDPGNIVEPTGSKKSTGFLSDERPPYQFFNWFWDAKRKWENWLAPAVRHNIIISDDVDEQDYASLIAYIAGAPVAGDRVLITNNQVIAAQIIIPSNITITIQDGIKFTMANNLASSLLQFGSETIVEGILILETSQAGVIDIGIEINGNGNNLNTKIINTAAGTTTTGIQINAAVEANHIRGEADNTGAGAITTVLNDASVNESNDVIFADKINNILERSLGSLSFKTGFTMDLGSDADGDIYYRDSGILKRLPKGADGQQLELVSGVPSWVNKPVGLIQSYILIRDEKAAGVDGGTFTLGAWRTRDLNTEVVDTGGDAVVAANQVTLLAGTYICRIQCPSSLVLDNKARLRNITDATTELIGTTSKNESGAGSSGMNMPSVIMGRFTIAASKVFEVQHWSTASRASSGFGVSGNIDSLNEIYTVVEFWKN